MGMELMDLYEVRSTDWSGAELGSLFRDRLLI